MDPILQMALLFLTGLVAGALNVVAGGGSMITLPVMIFLGLPATVANGTNRVAILVQNIGATLSFHKKGKIPPGWLRLAVPPALVGAGLGTWAAVEMGDAAFEKVLAVVLVVVAGYTLWKPRPPEATGVGAVPTGTRRLGFVGAFFFVGLYGGLIQAGLGFIILGVAAAGGLDLVRGNAMKAALVLTFTPLALAIFAWTGKVDWVMGASLAAGNFLGALAGVRLQILKGQAWIRQVVTVVIVVFAIRLLFFG